MRSMTTLAVTAALFWDSVAFGQANLTPAAEPPPNPVLDLGILDEGHMERIIQSVYSIFADYTRGSATPHDLTLGELNTVYRESFYDQHFFVLLQHYLGPQVRAQRFRRAYEPEDLEREGRIYDPPWHIPPVTTMGKASPVLNPLSIGEAIEGSAIDRRDLLEALALTTFRVTRGRGGEQETYRAAFLWVPSEGEGISFYVLDGAVPGVELAGLESLQNWDAGNTAAELPVVPQSLPVEKAHECSIDPIRQAIELAANCTSIRSVGSALALVGIGMDIAAAETAKDLLALALEEMINLGLDAGAGCPLAVVKAIGQLESWVFCRALSVDVCDTVQARSARRNCFDDELICCFESPSWGNDCGCGEEWAPMCRFPGDAILRATCGRGEKSREDEPVGEIGPGGPGDDGGAGDEEGQPVDTCDPEPGCECGRSVTEWQCAACGGDWGAWCSGTCCG